MKAHMHLVELMDLGTMEIMDCSTQIMIEQPSDELVRDTLLGYALYWVNCIHECEITFPTDIEETDGRPACHIQHNEGRSWLLTINLNEAY